MNQPEDKAPRVQGWTPVGLMAVALWVSGCAAMPHETGSLDVGEGRLAAQPPRFLTGPVSVVLTNTQDYTARVVVSGTNGVGTIAAGNLFQKDGVLLFVPGSEELTPQRTWKGSFRFLCDPGRNIGYVISEPLRGFTAFDLAGPYAVSDVLPLTTAPTVSQIDRPQGLQEEIRIRSPGGETAHLRAWRPEETTGPPLQVTSEATADSPAFTVRLSEVNLDPLSPEIFSVPPGFARYETSDGMVRALMRKAPVLPYSHSEEPRRRRGY